MIVDVDAEVFRWETRTDAWFFAGLPVALSDDVRELPHPPRGFGAVRVQATIGATTWRTSIFPDSRRGAYVLPLKRAVREAEGIPETGGVVRVRLEVLSG